LFRINLQVEKGSLIALCGQSGSGKSSLLSAILGEMHLIQGSIHLAPNEAISYVPQTIWIQIGTFRDNILFGLPYDKKRYDEVLELCDLKQDIETYRDGDQTEIGDQTNLSDDQKQRLALARTCYSNSSLVLL